MTKRHWRDSIKSFLGTHVSPEKTDQLEETKNEIENKVNKILKLIKDGGEEGNSVGNSNRESELFDLVKDFNKQYQSLYEQYDQLTAELKKFDDQEEKDGDLSTSSCSDSDPDHSSKENSTLWVENGALKQELQALKGDASDLKQRLEFANERAADLTQGLDSAQEENMALVSKNVEISNTMEQEQRIIQELTEEVQRLSERSNESEAELSDLKMVREELSAQLKGLEVYVTDLQSELGSLQTQKRELEEHFVDKSNEAKQLEEENLELQLVQTELQDKILEFEKISRGKEGEISAFLKKLEDDQSKATTQTENAKAQLNHLQLEVDSLHAKMSELEEQIKCRSDETKQLMEKNSVLLQGLTDVQDQVKDLQLEVKSLLAQKGELEEQITIKSHEAQELREENQALQVQDQTLDLERILSERGDELSNLPKKLEDNKNEEPAQIMDLTAQVNDLQVELEYSQKRQLELHTAGERQEAAGKQTQVENMNIELTRKVSEQQKLLKEKKDRINKLTIEYNQLEDLYKESLKNRQVVQKKIEETEEHLSNRDEMINMWQRMAEKLKKEVETARKVITALKTKLSEIEQNLFLQKRLQSTELDKAVATVEKERQTIKMLQRIQEEHQGVIARLQVEIKKVGVLELKVREGVEDEKLLRSIAELEKKARELENRLKEKEDEVLSMEEEKKEVIRQLCIWIDHHLDQIDYLKGLFIKTRVSNQRTT
ncbi:COP1-interactive protein 1-like [Telopea speciosissima]|uniref:COP1-interactive protein 1-like n=1 Tax=Telopea speciosissima TaxID=54955 RepID=UPI001CC34AD2|nr:COP1-interactive protein 1-like [Telopea speciosissima]